MKLKNLCSPEKRLFARKMRKNPTPAEFALWQAIRRRALGVIVRRQAIIRGYIVDFYIPAWKVTIEADGQAHDSREQIEYDERRNGHIRRLGFKVLRFKNEDVFNNLPWVIAAIKNSNPKVSQ